MLSQKFLDLTLRKVSETDSRLTTQMKSVGEVMAIDEDFKNHFKSD